MLLQVIDSAIVQSFGEAQRDQLELLASQRMVRMGYLEVGIGKVAMPCS